LISKNTFQVNEILDESVTLVDKYLYKRPNFEDLFILYSGNEYTIYRESLKNIHWKGKFDVNDGISCYTDTYILLMNNGYAKVAKIYDIQDEKFIRNIDIDKINAEFSRNLSKFSREPVYYSNNSIVLEGDDGTLIFLTNRLIVIKTLFSENPNGQWGEYYHDTSRNKLVKFINKTIHEVDLDTYEIEYFEPARFKDKDAEPNGGKWAQDETYIYYCSFDGTTVNALNKKTKEIDWQHQHKQNADDLDIVNEVPVRYQNVQYHQGRLFVMDNKRSLHIFEEEDMPKEDLLV
jgi:hypothetical protein